MEQDVDYMYLFRPAIWALHTQFLEKVAYEKLGIEQSALEPHKLEPQ